MNKLSNFAEKHFKKIAVGGALTIGLSLLVLMLITNTNIVKATSNWKDSLINKANMDIAITGQETVDELLAKDISIGNPEDLNSYIREQEALLDRLLREYYDAKLSGLTNESDLNALKAQIANIRANLLIEYKSQIDAELSKINL